MMNKIIFKNEEIKLKKIVPMIGVQSSGKNVLLNILFGINIEQNYDLVGNKFINIIRYNPEIQEPKFFHLKTKFKDNNYIFFKDKKFQEIIGFQEIIKEIEKINKNLLKGKEIKFIDNIYMTEINSISFPEHKEYFLQHVIIDFPLLSGDKSNNEIKKENENEIKENMSIQNFNRGIMEIFKNNIENFIILIDINNYKDEIYFNIIFQLKKITNKQIVNSLILFDISKAPGKYDNEYNNCKNYFVKHFPDFESFNFWLNKNIQINLIQIESELLIQKSFYHLLRYYFCLYNYQDDDNENESNEIESFSEGFINYLKKIIEKDFEYLKDKLDELNSEETFEIDNAIKKLNEKDKIVLTIQEEEDNDIACPDEDEDEISHKDILKMVFLYYKEKKFKAEYSYITGQLINYFKHQDELQKELLKIDNNFEINKIDKNDKIIVENLKLILEKLEKTKAFKNTIKNFKADIEELEQQNQNCIFIPFLGPSNSGKSTFLNAIIGKDILPISHGECTKKGIIISYSGDNEPDITIRNAKLKSKLINGTFKYYFDFEKIIASGFSKVKEILTSLNYEYNENDENCFYYLKTKIKLFDDMNLNKYFKNKIFLIDFPGYGNNNYFENNIFQKIFSLCNCFTFMMRDSRIFEKETQIILSKALEIIKESHYKFTVNGFIKSCLFICNIFDKTQTDDDKDIMIAKNDIQELTKVKNDKDINICFVKALKYSNDINNLNFFFDIEETINEEFQKFNGYKIYYYQIYIKKSSFEEYFNDIISKKLLELGFNYIPKEEAPSAEINIIKNKIEHFPMGNFSEKLKDDIAKKFYYVQQNFDWKFNYGKFEEGFKKLLENVFNEINKNKERIIQNQIDVFEKIIEQKFSEEISLDSFELLKKIREKYIKTIEGLYNYHKIKSSKQGDICSAFFSNISDYLNNTKKVIKDLLNKNDRKEIKDEIKNQISIFCEGISLSMEKYIDEINNAILNLNEKDEEEEKKLWDKHIVINITFKEFFTMKVSQKGIKIKEEIFNELNSCFENTKSQIWKNKKFIDWIESILFDKEYLKNFIEIVIETLEKKLKYILHLITFHLEDYKNQIIRIIQEKIEAIELAFVNLNPEELEQIKKLCEPLMNEIKKTLSVNLNKDLFN